MTLLSEKEYAFWEILLTCPLARCIHLLPLPTVFVSVSKSLKAFHVFLQTYLSILSSQYLPIWSVYFSSASILVTLFCSVSLKHPLWVPSLGRCHTFLRMSSSFFAFLSRTSIIQIPTPLQSLIFQFSQPTSFWSSSTFIVSATHLSLLTYCDLPFYICLHCFLNNSDSTKLYLKFLLLPIAYTNVALCNYTV